VRPFSRFGGKETDGVWPDAGDEISLAYLPPTPRQTRAAFAGAIILLLGLAALIPFAANPLPQFNGFIPALDTTIFVTEIITASLLFVHFSITRSRALLALACGYLFSALMVAAHGLSFPEAFLPAGNLGTSARLNLRIYLLWHLGLPAALFAYVWLRDKTNAVVAARTPIAIVVICCVASVLALVCGAVSLANIGDGLPLPPSTNLSPFSYPSAPLLINLTMLTCVAALFVLWAFRRSVLDQWLLVALLASTIELAITGRLGWTRPFLESPGLGSRFTVGFYTGRTLFSLITSTIILIALLAETTRLYAVITRAKILESTINASQVFSSEVELPALMNQLMKIALEKTGADRGLLILPKEDGYSIQAEARAKGFEIEVSLCQQPITGAACPEQLVRGVVRTRKALILDVVSNSDLFLEDGYLRDRRPKSLLCLPLIKQRALTGILLLENTLTSNAFTPDRIAVLELLASQAAISLENTRLYSDLQEREAKLRRSEAWLSQAQRLSRTGNWVYNPATMLYVYWSDESYRIWGFDPLQGLPSRDAMWQRIHPDDRDRVWETVQGAVEHRTDFTADFRILLPDGTVKYLEGTSHHVYSPVGALSEVFTTVVDVTQRRRAQEEHEKLRHLESDIAHINRVSMMGELAASLSHEIKQPIATTRLLASTAMRSLDKSLPDLVAATKALTGIVDSAHRAENIINRIRDQIKKAPPQKKCFDLSEAINEVIGLARSAIIENKISVQTRLADRTPALDGDRVQLQQVLLNLILNAVEAMGSVEAGPRELLISTEQDHTGVLVAVCDSGPGIDETQLERVFDTFYTTKSNGTGMGLSICQHIIDAHGGRLWADANKPRGAVFQFTLPNASVL
jgi:signal transduction histidine kinase